MNIDHAYIENRTLRDFLVNTNISLKHSYIYFAIGKVANSSIKYYLQSVEYEGTPFKVVNVHNRHLSPLLSPYQLVHGDWELLLGRPDIRKFALVRNPYSRLLSCYLDRMKDAKSMAYKNVKKWTGVSPEKLSFSNFLEIIAQQKPHEMDSHWRPQVFETYYDVIEMSQVFYFENLPESLHNISNFLFNSVKPVFCEAENKSPSLINAQKKLDEYYIPKVVDQAFQIYTRDFKVFGYNEDPSILVTNFDHSSLSN